MAEPSSQPLTDVDVLAWSVVLTHRERQRRDDLNILLMPHPPCPTCGEPVHEAEQVTLDRPDRLIADIRLTTHPCGHVHATTDEHVRRLWLHIHEMTSDVASGYHGHAVEARTWTTDEIVREAQTRVDGKATEADSYPQPAPEEVQVRPDPRQPAYDAVYEYINSLGPYLPPDPSHRNAVIWRAVHVALDSTPIGRCVSSHCVEGGHILDLGEAHA